jgi:hypothetical protein
MFFCILVTYRDQIPTKAEFIMISVWCYIKKRATYKDNTIIGPVCYFGGIMNQYPPQWNVMTLEGEITISLTNHGLIILENV